MELFRNLNKKTDFNRYMLFIQARQTLVQYSISTMMAFANLQLQTQKMRKRKRTKDTRKKIIILFIFFFTNLLKF